MMSAATNIEIDDSLYSRQRYMLGDGAMIKMAHSSVFLSGLGGLGVEIAKNIVLAGIKSITLHDTKIACSQDLGSQFFLREDDVRDRKNRAEASASQLAELNPHVNIQTSTSAINEDDYDFLKHFQCVIFTEAPICLQLKVDMFCRTQQPPIKFICAGVHGVFSWAFCDFGPQFEVLDSTGEEPKECFIWKITKANPGVVTTLDNRMHGFQTGDKVTFKEIVGMTALNGTEHTIKVLSPYAFSICDTSDPQYEPYQYGGIAKQVKASSTLLTFESLETQLSKPDILTADLSKIEIPLQLHFGIHALQLFEEQNGRSPEIRNKDDAAKLYELAKSLNSKAVTKADELDDKLIFQLSFSSRGSFPPLAASLGGIVGQEVLKALTGKYTPLRQWLYIDATEVLKGQEDLDTTSFLPRQDRYDLLRICIGEELRLKLANLRLFMVGCGAIGCELLKNFALLGISTGQTGMMTVTDNDLIEKSNLNRQFLFRPHHIQKPKSVTAASSVASINPDVHVDPHQHKVCPETEESLYTDKFFESQDLIVNALDNVEARRYMDSRCVSTQRALLESGTMGPKGHVQVIVPHLTESYASQRDPPEEEVPHCTLKSFPAIIEHTIQWARDKFENCFTQKPELYKKFWESSGSPEQLLQTLQSGNEPEGVYRVLKLLKRRPKDWASCVELSRRDFEKYYNHKAKQLLHAFPLDTRVKDGSLFWQSPKRPPIPQQFDAKNDLHMMFIRSSSKLHADSYGIQYTKQDLSDNCIVEILQRVQVPEFIPKSKQIETDETASKSAEASSFDVDKLILYLKELIAEGLKSSEDVLPMFAQEFEKDDDSNGHIDFITSASNLRATMYSIENADRLKTKKIAGKIVPAIATTTAAVAGLVAIELVKIVMKSSAEDYKNCFMNLALPYVIFSEPGPPEVTVIRDDLSFTNWDKWIVQGTQEFKLKDFVRFFKEKYGFEVSIVVNGVKIVYVPLLPGHSKRLDQKMTKLIKPSGKDYVDLTVSFEGDEEDDLPGPPVRYYFGL
ncbi:ubiquitin-like modifier-activating enzyme 6 [Acropora palmata]|uniref:ubiquitin-like modifier-activating enzyme 6 n=1 Tax=Acropora palmata TaxID=6131 RepID=UPI003D9FCEEB